MHVVRLLKVLCDDIPGAAGDRSYLVLGPLLSSLYTGVASEERDDTPEALDKVWEEEMVKFVDDQGSSCGTGGVVGQRRRELEQTQTIHLSDQLMTDATPRQAGRA